MQKIAQTPRTEEPTPKSDAVAITRWWMSDATVVDLPGKARPHPDTLDYRFVNGWVATGDLPCRQALREMLPSRKIVLSDCPELTSIYPGVDGPRVDFSTFCFTPKLISRWAQATLTCTGQEAATLRLETCGGLHAWVGSTKVATFEPYDRNVPHTYDVGVTLPAEKTTITVYFDDLHERDTSCYFQMVVLGAPSLTQIAPSADAQDGNNVAACLGALRTKHIFHHAEPIEVLTDHTLRTPLDLTLDQDPAQPVTMNVFADPARIATRATLFEQGRAEKLLGTADVWPGGVLLPLSTEVDGIRYTRTIGTTVLPVPNMLTDARLADRKARALDLICARGQRTPARALALLARGQTSEVEAVLEPALTAVENRHDCADFVVLPLLRIWRDHVDVLPTPLRERLRHAILGFRYWLDEPGNDVMWFWSENHAMCFHASQYIAGDLFRNDRFTASGRTGAAQRTLGHERLERWFASIRNHGLGEWNSAAYYPIDLLGLLTLYDMAPDAAIRAAAGDLCDRIFHMVALHTCGGVPAGSQGRCYEKELFAGPATELGAVAAIAFGGPWHAGHERAAALLAISDYTPPDDVTDALSPPAGRAVAARYVQGLGANARLTVWKTAHIQLSSVSDHKTGDVGHQQHVVDVQMAAHPLARLWVNHPGDLKVWGGARPSLWAGSGVLPKVSHSGDQAMLVFDLNRQDHPIRLTHAFVPRDVMDEVLPDNHWIFARCGEAFAALWSSEPPQCSTTGLYAGSEWIADAAHVGWVVIVGDSQRYGTFNAFQNACRIRAPSFDAGLGSLRCGGRTVAFDDPPDPDFPMSLTPKIKLMEYGNDASRS